jgi:SAM-dependent methyltransferase
MRPSIKKFVHICAEELPLEDPIYEFGSLQVPGQEGFADLRPYFPGRKYLGADMAPGPGVDVVLNLHHIDLPSESVGTAISCDTLEHVEYPRKALSELSRILKPGGILIISSVMLYRIHAAPNDYWRFTPEGFKSLLSQFPSSYVDWNGKEENPHTVVGVGMKGDYSFDSLISRRGEWRSVRDVPLREKLFALIVGGKKKVERYMGGNP